MHANLSLPECATLRFLYTKIIESNVEKFGLKGTPT